MGANVPDPAGAYIGRVPYALLDLEPKPYHALEGSALDDALAVAADFIDLKSPFMSGHSRRCAQLAGDAAEVLGFSEDEVVTLRRAALWATQHAVVS